MTVRHLLVPVACLPALVSWLVPASLACLAAVSTGCSDASGQVQGGETIFEAGAPITGDDAGAVDAGPVGPHAFADLYADFFGPMGTLPDGGMGGVASCSGSPAACHMLANDTGAAFSGFTCGSSQSDCYTGMTKGSCSSGTVMPCPIVQTGDATMTGLHLNLYKYDGTGNMPLSPVYQFKREDMARIDAWIAEGANP